MKLTTLLIAGAAVIGLAAALPFTEATPDDCNHGWCGAPFCSPECGPNGKEKRDVAEKRQEVPPTDIVADADKCNHGWCGAPFCYPECGPNGKEKRDVAEKRQHWWVPPPTDNDADTESRCEPHWCGARVCNPKCRPAGWNSKPSEAVKLKAREDGEAVQLKAREEASADKCNHGWCGAPFCYPECGPNGKREVATTDNDADAESRCRHGWCSAPFCYPECAPGGGKPSAATKLKAREDGEAVQLRAREVGAQMEAEKRQVETREASTDKCNHGWCGAPFCYPECGPNGKRAVEIEAREATSTTDKCHPGWCGAPFCWPECGPEKRAVALNA
ncbi:hypothetical protein BU16DRAFT_568157 [Lophium mytilinum]|uniref:Uncharacterized protein n=1 Tax=Lophium mytilinum TaxID=390894 RepID=A0A6A6Q9E5_9PEZI|nr:hypothetical protein BU16DRAFT_568157 [Lophium mytilinum]